MTSPPIPSNIIVHQQSKQLELVYADGQSYRLPFEYLRVYSPSAEVRGHHPDQAILQVGKRHVSIQALEPVGHYGVKPIFSDGHETGIYTWPYLHELATQYEMKWQQYLQAIEAAGASREPRAPEGFQFLTPQAPSSALSATRGTRCGE